jgi:hypothetical protein
MMLAYLPGERLLYTAEAVQLYPSGLSATQTAIEAIGVVNREHLAPTRFIGMHVAVTPWATLVGIVDSLTAQGR